jgi:acetylglutamate kinase
MKPRIFLSNDEKPVGLPVVVKYGGNAMVSGLLKAAVVEDLVFLREQGVNVVLVHGGGPEIEALLKKTGKESRFVNGLRYTDAETMDLVLMALCGKVNKELVALIEQAGAGRRVPVHALGLCGIDGSLLRATRLAGEEDLGLVGEIRQVNTGIVRDALAAGFLPVIAPVALNDNGEESLCLNVNADTAACEIAGRLRASALILMTDISGILRDVHDPSSLITHTTLAGLEELKRNGALSRGMLPKAACCAGALRAGVRSVRVIDGRIPHILRRLLLEGENTGTEISDEPAGR